MSVALPTPVPTKLNLGCGQFPREGFLNVDVDAAAKADVWLDLANPESLQSFPPGHFEVIVMDHVLEHLDDVFGVMAAVHRLLTPGGRLEIRVPHFSRGITHPEHKHGFDVTFPEYVRPDFRGGSAVCVQPLLVHLGGRLRADRICFQEADLSSRIHPHLNGTPGRALCYARPR